MKTNISQPRKLTTIQSRIKPTTNKITVRSLPDVQKNTLTVVSTKKVIRSSTGQKINVQRPKVRVVQKKPKGKKGCNCGKKIN